MLIKSEELKANLQEKIIAIGKCADNSFTKQSYLYLAGMLAGLEYACQIIEKEET